MADATSLVAAAVSEILERLKPAQLAAALEARGVKSSRGRYAVPTIYRWAEGGIMPRADVFLEAARIANVSVDGYLYGGPLTAGAQTWVTRQEFEQLRETLAATQYALAVLQGDQTTGGNRERIS